RRGPLRPAGVEPRHVELGEHAEIVAAVGVRAQLEAEAQVVRAPGFFVQMVDGVGVAGCGVAQLEIDRLETPPAVYPAEGRLGQSEVELAAGLPLDQVLEHPGIAPLVALEANRID